MGNIGALGVIEPICCMRLEFGQAKLGYKMDTCDGVGEVCLYSKVA